MRLEELAGNNLVQVEPWTPLRFPKSNGQISSPSDFHLYYFLIKKYLLIVCVCMHVRMHAWRLEEICKRPWLFFHHAGPRD